MTRNKLYGGILIPSDITLAKTGSADKLETGNGGRFDSGISGRFHTITSGRFYRNTHCFWICTQECMKNFGG